MLVMDISVGAGVSGVVSGFVSIGVRRVLVQQYVGIGDDVSIGVGVGVGVNI